MCANTWVAHAVVVFASGRCNLAESVLFSPMCAMERGTGSQLQRVSYENSQAPSAAALFSCLPWKLVSSSDSLIPCCPAPWNSAGNTHLPQLTPLCEELRGTKGSCRQLLALKGDKKKKFWAHDCSKMAKFVTEMLNFATWKMTIFCSQGITEPMGPDL